MIVWYLNHYAMLPGSGPAGRPYHISRAFIDHGHQPLVFFASYHHLNNQQVAKDLQNRSTTHEGVDYYCLPARTYQGNRLGRLLNMLDYTRGVSRLGRQVESGRLDKPDIIISSSPHLFCFPAAERLAGVFKSALIFEIRDLWPLELKEILRLPSLHPLILWMSHIERRAYKNAHAVISPLPRALDYMEKRGLDPERFFHIPNGISKQEWTEPHAPLPQKHRAVFDQLRDVRKLIVVYTGAHGPPNALDQILSLQTFESGDRPYHFVLIGDGVCKKDLQQRVRKQGLDFITFLPRLGGSAARAALACSDVCFIGWRKRDIYLYGISPNKIGEYFMAGKPVLHAVIATNDPVAEARAGISVDPYHHDQLERALQTFAGMNLTERKAMGERGRSYALRQLEWSTLGRKYVEICERQIWRQRHRLLFVEPDFGKYRPQGTSEIL